MSCVTVSGSPTTRLRSCWWRVRSPPRGDDDGEPFGDPLGDDFCDDTLSDEDDDDAPPPPAAVGDASDVPPRPRFDADDDDDALFGLAFASDWPPPASEFAVAAVAGFGLAAAAAASDASRGERYGLIGSNASCCCCPSLSLLSFAMVCAASADGDAALPPPPPPPPPCRRRRRSYARAPDARLPPSPRLPPAPKQPNHPNNKYQQPSHDTAAAYQRTAEPDHAIRVYLLYDGGHKESKVKRSEAEGVGSRAHRGLCRLMRSRCCRAFVRQAW